ncbi:MAG: ABC transporter ATP-binding protein [Candidatus Heimdallarchaeota archaeon]|nr:ABC transporter ATP-binding protein [Candidatus Heimdallarchaeota archaeon]MDH5644695.1 ABC transporter ATP-binding protein [Candidatus Heimdallarchaeota archaeon]
MIINLREITLQYSNHILFENLSVEFYSGKLNTLLGKSGIGKTSILKIIAGIETNYTGEVYFDDINVTNLSIKDRSVGWVPQQQLLFPSMNVYKNVEYGLLSKKLSRERRKSMILEISELTGINHLLDRNIEKLSGGEKQRVALTRSLILKPRVLLMDEPFSSLDTPERKKLSLLLKDIQLETGITTIHVTHSSMEAELISDYLYILSDQMIIQQGSPMHISNRPFNTEVARIMNLSNVITKGSIEGILSDVIIPTDAIKLSQNGIAAKVISQTRETIHLRLMDGTLLEMNNNSPVKLGELVFIELDPDRFYKFR